MRKSSKLLISIAGTVSVVLFINLFYLMVKSGVPSSDAIVRNGNNLPARLSECDKLDLSNAQLNNGWQFIGSVTDSNITKDYVLLDNNDFGLISSKLNYRCNHYLQIRFEDLIGENITLELHGLDADGNVIESETFTSSIQNGVFEYQNEYYHKQIVQFSIQFKKNFDINSCKINSFVIYDVR